MCGVRWGTAEQLDDVEFGTPDWSVRLGYHHLAMWSPTAVRQGIVGCVLRSIASHRIASHRRDPSSCHSNGRWTAKPVTVWYDVKPGRQSIPDVPLHVLKHKKLDTAQAGWGKVDTDAIARHVGATCWRPCTHTSASRTRRSPRNVGACAARRVEAVPRGRGCVPHGTGVVDGGGMRDGAWNGHVAASVCPLLRAC